MSPAPVDGEGAHHLQAVRQLEDGHAGIRGVLDDQFLAGFLEYSSGNISTKSTIPTGMSAASIRSTYASRGTAYRQYDNFYDEITGEAKLIVRLEWDESANDNNGAWKVTRKEYAE